MGKCVKIVPDRVTYVLEKTKQHGLCLKWFTKGRKVMKKLQAILLALTMLMSVLSFSVYGAEAAGAITVWVDGEQLDFDAQPYLDQEHGRTMVPLRKIFEELGAEVTWDEETKTAFASKGDISLSITVDDNRLYKNGAAVELDAPARQVNDSRTMVPVRAIAEGLNASVSWDEEKQQVLITTTAESIPAPTAVPVATPVPSEVPDDMDDARIAMSRKATVILKTDGTLWSMGDNTYGQLGYNTNYTKSMIETDKWAQITGIPGTVAAVYCGEDTHYALCADGTVWSWGSNRKYLLGSGQDPKEVLSRCIPEKIEGLDNVRKLACGESYTLALKADGTVWGWGENLNWLGGLSEEQKVEEAKGGQIMDLEREKFLYEEILGNSYYFTKVPAQVTVVEDAKDIAVADTFALALRKDGTVYAWGEGSNWKVEQEILRENAHKFFSVPRLLFTDASFPQRLKNITQISAGAAHAAALQDDGGICVWGTSALGVGGSGITAAEYLSHPLITNGYTAEDGRPIMSNAKSPEGVIKISASAYYNVALRDTGTLYIWGESPILPYTNRGYRQEEYFGTTIHEAEITDVKRVYTTYQSIDDYEKRYEGLMKKKDWVEIPMPKLIVEKNDHTLWEVNFAGDKMIADLKSEGQ